MIVGRKTLHWKSWSEAGITFIGDIFEGNEIMPFTQLVTESLNKISGNTVSTIKKLYKTSTTKTTPFTSNRIAWASTEQSGD